MMKINKMKILQKIHLSTRYLDMNFETILSSTKGLTNKYLFKMIINY